MKAKERKLRDCMLLLKLAYKIYNEYETNEDIQTHIIKIYNNFHKKLGKNKYTAADVTQLSKYLETINTYNCKEILTLGKKVSKIK
jgi:GDP-D-mannose dehydratase